MLTLHEKIELVASRYDVETICDALEIESLTLLEVFHHRLDDNWHKFEDIELDIDELLGDCGCE